MQATVQILKGLWRLTCFSLCSLPLVLLDLDQPAGLVLNIPYYFHCSVLRHLPNAERFEFHTGRSVFICLQKHFSRAASCGHATIQAAPAPLSHLSKLKGSMKKDLQNHAHCFHNRFSVNHREKHVVFWDYKALFSPVESATFLFFPSTMSFIFQTHGSRPYIAGLWQSTRGTLCPGIPVCTWNKVQEKSKYCPLGFGPGWGCHPSCSWSSLGGSHPQAASNHLLLPFLYIFHWRQGRVISCIDIPQPTSISVGPFIEDSPVVLRALTRIISKEWTRWS